MKRVKELSFFKNIKEVREFEFGTFYFFDALVISEINAGIFFQWEMAKKAVKASKEFYGENEPIAYISNRINNYTVAPADWLKFYTNRHELTLYSVVGSTKGSLPSTFLEKMFFKGSLQQFDDLEKAIAWSMDNIKKRRTLS